MLLNNLQVIDTGHDKIPDFAANPTVETVASGVWSDPSIWSTGVPTAEDIVRINADHRVYSIGVHDMCNVLGIHGELRQYGEFEADTVLVYPDGKYIMHGGELWLGRHVPMEIDPDQFNGGLIVLGDFAAAPVGKASDGPISIERILYPAHEIKAGDTLIELVDNCNLPNGAHVTLRLADTREGTWHFEGHSLWEYGDGESEALGGYVINSGSVIALVSPARCTHAECAPIAIVHVDGCPRISSNCGNNPAHVLFTADAKVHCDGVSFVGLGRTKAEPFHAVNNHIGRYAVHCHHMHHPPTIINCSIWGGRRWGLAIHGTNNGLFEGNVICDIEGAGIAIEQGNESYNIIRGNYVLGIRGTPGVDINQRSEEPSQRVGCGLWENVANVAGGKPNEVTDNIFANCQVGRNFFRPRGDDSSVRSATNVWESRSAGRDHYNHFMYCSVGVEMWGTNSHPVVLEGCVFFHCHRGVAVKFDAFGGLTIGDCDFTGTKRYQAAPTNDQLLDGRRASMALQLDGGYLGPLVINDCVMDGFDYALWNHFQWSHSEWLIDGPEIRDCHVGLCAPIVLREGQLGRRAWHLRDITFERVPRPAVLGIFQPEYRAVFEPEADENGSYSIGWDSEIIVPSVPN